MRRLAVIERDDIGVIIVLKVLLVHEQQLFIVDENEGKVAQPALMQLSNLLEPFFDLATVFQSKVLRLYSKLNQSFTD